MLGGSGLGDEEEMWAMGMREVMDEIAAEEAESYAGDDEEGEEDVGNAEEHEDEEEAEDEDARDEESKNEEESKTADSISDQNRARRERILKGIKFGQL